MNEQQQDTMHTLYLTTHEMRLMLYALTVAGVMADRDIVSGMNTQRMCFSAIPGWVGKETVQRALEAVEGSLRLSR